MSFKSYVERFAEAVGAGIAASVNVTCAKA